jgi:hypothetical protein
MNFLKQERETLEKLLPGLDAALARMPHSVKAAVDRAAALAVELLGPAAFIQSPEVSYFYAATAVLALHPPARLGACKRLDAYLAGSPLVLD